MSASGVPAEEFPLPPVAGSLARSQDAALRRLFLMLFLRGRSSRGLRKERAPRSIGSKLGLILALYCFVGLSAVAFWGQPVFVLALSQHSITFLFLSMFFASSSGEVLFNKEEADILLHRPIAPARLLRAKVRVLVEVSLWLAGALNLVSFAVGSRGPGGALFVVAHAGSVVLEALFCAGFVVLVYQLCLRWFGRERFESFVTTSQVLVGIAAVTGGQLVRPLLRPMLHQVGGTLGVGQHNWWLALLPPVWFASLDDALAGTGTSGAWLLAGVGLIATAGVLGAAFGKLSGDYQRGLQALNDVAPSARRRQAARRWFDVLVNAPPLRWWLRDPVTRAAFLLTSVYLVRDRDLKLRVYPSLAPMFVFPFIFIFDSQRGRGLGEGFAIAFLSGSLGIFPLIALSTLQFSQQWQASDVFRAAPIRGPAALSEGARRAVLAVLTLPALALVVAISLVVRQDSSQLLLLLPGIIAIPVFSLVPCLGGKAVPLSLPSEEAKAASRGATMWIAMLAAFAISGLGVWAHSAGWLGWFLLAETALAIGVYGAMRASIATARWSSME